MKNFIGSFNIPDVSYHSPRDIPEALALIHAHPGQILIIAGCTDVIPMIRRGKLAIQPQTHLIDIKGIGALQEISADSETVVIGAAVPYSSILESDLLAEACPLLIHVVSDIGSMQIRNAGTIGGNLCTASPGGDASVGLLSLEADIRLVGPDGARWIPVTDFFTGYGTTVLRSEELLSAVRFPRMTPSHRFNWIKLGRRSAFTMSVLSLALTCRIQEGSFDSVRLAMGLAGPTPLRIAAVEAFLQGRKATAEAVAGAAALASENINPRSSFRASAEYRKDMAEVLVKRALTNALKREID